MVLLFKLKLIQSCVSVGRSATDDPTLDPSCACKCPRCLCLLKKDPADGTSMCLTETNAKTFDEVKELEDATVDEIMEIQQNRSKMNYGLYLRSRMLCSTRKRSLTFVVPLKYLNIFFSHECYIPLRQVITVELVMQDDRNLLVVKDGLANSVRYKLAVSKAFLNLRFCTMEPRLRTKWLDSINNLTLTRNFQAAKCVHFNIKGGKSTARYSSIFAYSALPAYLKIFFISETAHTGDYKTNKFSYTHHNVQSISIFKSGIPHSTNTITCDMKLEKYGYHHMYWFKEFQRMYGPTSYDISAEYFHSDLFCYCFNLTPNPLLSGDKAIALEPQDRTLSFVEGAVLDVNLAFSESLAQNTMVFFVGYFDLIQSFDANGLNIVT